MPGALETHDVVGQLLIDRIPHVEVTVVHARGSTPQDSGSRMIVTAEGLHCGTVGGGKIEARAIAHAQGLLNASPGGTTDLVEWNLQRDIGMTCGGVMTLFFKATRFGAGWTIVIFGAGHVASHLVPVLLPLDCSILCFDTRDEWIRRLPSAPNLKAACTADLAAVVPQLPADASVLLMTQGHSTDLPILRALLADGRIQKIAVIGSAAKRAALIRELQESGIPGEKAGGFACPAGLPIGSNHPHEIAISIAAGLLAGRDAPCDAADQ